MIEVKEALRDAMAECMRDDEKVFIIGEEVAEYNGAYKVTKGLLDEFGPKRVIDSPITEYGFTGLAVGAAFNGLRPVVEFMTFNFSLQAIDHIINSAAKTKYMSGGMVKCPIVFRGPNGTAKGVGAQHAQCLASWYGHCPGLQVIAPYTSADAKILLKKAIKNDSPVVFLEHELMYGSKFEIEEGYDIEIGQARVAIEGTDVTVISFSYAMKFCHEAAEILKNEHNINIELIDLVSIKPLDKNTIIESIKKTNRAVVVEEGWGFAGIGSEISSMINEEAFDYLDCQVERVYGKDIPMPYAQILEDNAIVTAQEIVNSVLKVCYKK